LYFEGKIELREESVETLLSTACLLRLCEVIRACCHFLNKQLHPSNAIGIYLFADSHSCTQLRDAALAYVQVSLR
jgi:kelch-like protein 1/4/5